MKFLPIFIILFIIVIDLSTKVYMYDYFHENNRLHTQVQIIDDYLRFIYVENKGMAFGIGSSLPVNVKNYLFTGLTLLAIGVILYYYFSVKKKKTIVRSSLALILGGAAGNFADKVFGYFIYEGKQEFFFGKVVDFIDMGFNNERWPTYNVADIAITIGVFLLIIVMLLSRDDDLFSHSNEETKA